MKRTLGACLRSLFQSRAREDAVGFRVREALPYGRGSVRPTLLQHHLRSISVCFLLFVLAASARADLVVTSDGSRIVGTVERMAGGILVIVTEFAGRLEIDAAKIKSIATDGQLNVEFTSGDRLVGAIQAEPKQEGAVMRTALGNIPVTIGRIKAAWPVGAESPEVIALKKKAEATKRALEPKWTATLEAGGSMTEGNTDTLEVRGRFDLQRKADSDLLKLYLAATYSERDDSRTENEYKGGVWFESAFDERRFWYTRTELEFDEFEDLDLRATAAAGAGLYWFKNPDRELKTSAGIGYRHEAFDTGRTTNEAVIDLTLDYRLDIAPWVQLTHKGFFSPAIEDFDDYRLAFDTALVFPFKKEIWKLKLGMNNQYNARPQPGVERLDNTYYANVVLELK